MMEMIAKLVETPSDLKFTKDAESHVVVELLSFPAEIANMEPEIRHAIADVMRDREYIGGDADLFESYLDGIGEPLQKLRAFGIQILVLLREGTVAFESALGKRTIPKWCNLFFVFSWKPCYFMVKKDGSHSFVHKLDPQCDSAMKEIASTMGKLSEFIYWNSLDGVKSYFEGNPPLCITCDILTVGEER